MYGMAGSHDLQLFGLMGLSYGWGLSGGGCLREQGKGDRLLLQQGGSLHSTLSQMSYRAEYGLLHLVFLVQKQGTGLKSAVSRCGTTKIGMRCLAWIDGTRACIVPMACNVPRACNVQGLNVADVVYMSQTY